MLFPHLMPHLFPCSSFTSLLCLFVFLPGVYTKKNIPKKQTTPCLMVSLHTPASCLPTACDTFVWDCFQDILYLLSRGLCCTSQGLCNGKKKTNAAGNFFFLIVNLLDCKQVRSIAQNNHFINGNMTLSPSERNIIVNERKLFNLHNHT